MVDSAIQVLNSCGQKVYYAQQLSNILLHINRTYFVSLRLKERDILLIIVPFSPFFGLMSDIFSVQHFIMLVLSKALKNKTLHI